MEDINKIKRRIENLSGLPTLPETVKEINERIAKPKTSAEDLGKIISKDQVLSAKVLKLINSAYYGFPGRISSVTHGIVLLGFSVIKNLVISSTVFDIMEGKMIDLWKHSLGTAITSGLIGKRLKQEYPEENNDAGLLHDIGKVIIKVCMPDKYESILKVTTLVETSMFEAEKQILGVSHADIGGILAEKWNLPENLREPITYHHCPDKADTFLQKTATIHLADILVKGIGQGHSGDMFVPPLNKKAWEVLNLSKKDIQGIIIEMFIAELSPAPHDEEEEKPLEILVEELEERFKKVAYDPVLMEIKEIFKKQLVLKDEEKPVKK